MPLGDLVCIKPNLGLDNLLRDVIADIQLTADEDRLIAFRIRWYKQRLIRQHSRCCKVYCFGSVANTISVAGKSDIDLTILCHSNKN
jgi:hypothetical protein